MTTKTLWAPWRMEFILGEKESGCVLCRLAKSEDQSNDLVLAKGEHAYVVLNRYPYNNAHLMVVPYQHTESLGDLDAATSAELIKLLGDWTALLKKHLNAEGINIGLNLGKAAGAGIEDHLHFHLVPRWFGDTNFMPVMADTRVLPEALQETYQKLKTAWEDR